MKKLLVLAIVAVMIAVVSVGFAKTCDPNTQDPNMAQEPNKVISWFAKDAEPAPAEPNASEPNAPEAPKAKSWFALASEPAPVEPNASEPNAPEAPKAPK